MTIAHSRLSLRSLCAGVTIALLPGIGMIPGHAVLAEDGADAKRAEDPAEAQRQQQIKQLTNHYEQQFTKLLYGDLELLRAVCGDLPRESRRAIATSGEQAAREAALRLAELQMGGRQRRGAQGGTVVNGAAAYGKDAADPATIVSVALSKSVAEHVGGEQATAFTEQLARRNDRRKAAMIREIVAMLDGELVLTAAQREEIERSLRERWNDSMAMTLQGIHMNNGLRMFPGLPGACISPHLTKAQRQRFVPQPDATNQERVRVQPQAWMQAVNILNNVQPAGRDPWWFE